MPPRLSQKGRLQVRYIVLEQTRLLHQGTPLDRLLNISSSSILTCSDSLSRGPVDPVHKILRQHKSQAGVACYTTCRLVTLDAQCLSR